MILRLSLLLSASLQAAVPPGSAFLEKHCIECHDAQTKNCDLDLMALAFDPNDKTSIDHVNALSTQLDAWWTPAR